MKVVITGTSRGIGREAALVFLRHGHEVHGLDVAQATISAADCPGGDGSAPAGSYTHHICDVSDKESLPEIPHAAIVINNAGVQTATERDIAVNLLGAMYVTERYAFQPDVRSVLFNASVSALNGNEFATYAASKAGVLGYMRHCAIRLANEYRATCNALCFGGVLTELNAPVTQDKRLWERIMDVTPLKRWTTVAEAAAWCYFMTVTNTSCTGQAIDISCGERTCADLFVWPEEEGA